jgi:hypothetical protein
VLPIDGLRPPFLHPRNKAIDCAHDGLHGLEARDERTAAKVRHVFQHVFPILQVLRRPLPFLPRRDVRCSLIEHHEAHGGEACTQRKDGAAAKFAWAHRFAGGPVAGTMSAVCQVTMFSGETGGQATRRQATELRHYSREPGRWPAVLETREGWLLRLPLIDLSRGGAKVRFTERLTEGTMGRVYFLPPHWDPSVVEAIVWRIDLDGIVLRFTDSSLGTPPAVRALRRGDGGDKWLT